MTTPTVDVAAAPPPRVVPVVRRLLALTASRAALAAIALGAAFLAGAEGASGAGGFAFGAGVSAVMLLADRRSLLVREPTIEPLPPDAAREPWPRYVAAGLFPSTVGVSVLAAVSLADEETLAAVLAGVLAGMAIAGTISSVRVAAQERREGVRFFRDAGRSGRAFSEPR